MSLLLAACAAPAPPALPLQPDDFTLGGIPLDADTAELRLTFGDPDSVAASANPFEADTPLVTWIYDGFEVRLSGAVPVGYMILAAGESTARGLRVGHSARDVRQLYGDPATRVDSGWTYVDTSDAGGMRVISIVIAADTVRRIYIGRALD